MATHYDILGITHDASPREIKSAFRRLAKKHHPDLVASAAYGSGSHAVDGTRASDAAMRALLVAYRVLSDPESRHAYDMDLRRRSAESGGFDYHAFLRARRNDPRSQARLVVYDLLHDLEDEAIEIYERSKTFGDFRLEKWMDRGEAMDAEFCIAEEYEKRGKWLKAHSIYKRLIVMEAQKPWFRYFHEVLVFRFRTVLLVRLSSVLDEEDYLDRLDEAIGLDLGKKENALFLKRKAEIHIQRREFGDAASCLSLAMQILPTLAGLTALRKKAGMT